jgi:hypothetical protein
MRDQNFLRFHSREDFFALGGINTSQEWSGCLSDEKDQQVRNLGFTEIRSANRLCVREQIPFARDLEI